MNLNDYMDRAIVKITQTAAAYNIQNANGRRFMARFVPAMHSAGHKRRKMEKDGRHIPPFLIASIATQCNLFCKGCYARAGGNCGDRLHNQEMSAEQWNSIFSQARDLGIPFILLAGGEPMMRMDILKAASAWPQIAFPVFTNGTLLDETNIAFLNESRNIIPVLSIEGDEEATDSRRGKGIFEKLNIAMAKLKEKKIMFGLSITVTSENMNLVTEEHFVSQLADSGCTILFYVEYVPAQKGSEYLALSDEQIICLDNQIKPLKTAHNDMVILSFPGDEKEMGGCLAAGRGFFHINPSGGAEPCPFSPYSDTSLKTHTLLEALESPLFVKLQTEGILTKPHTGGCVLFEHEQLVAECVIAE